MFGQPTLLPTSVYACPNETVAFTCSDSQILAVQWKLDIYIKQGADQLTFISSDPVGTAGNNSHGYDICEYLRGHQEK